jgi:hypothetical protein
VDPEVVLRGVLPPVGATLLLVSLGGVRLLPLAVGIGLLVAYGLLKAWPALPHELWASQNGTEWLLWGIVALGLVAALDHRRWLGSTGMPVAVLVGAGAGWLVLQKVASHWATAQAVVHVGGGLAIVALGIAGHRRVLANAPATVLPAILFTVVLSFDAVLLTLGESALLGQLCGAVAAALGAAVGTALWRRPFALAPADATWLGGAHALFLLAGVHLAYLSWPVASLALVAPLTLLPLRGNLRDRPRSWARVATPLALAPMVVALVLSLVRDAAS